MYIITLTVLIRVHALYITSCRVWIWESHKECLCTILPLFTFYILHVFSLFCLRPPPNHSLRQRALKALDDRLSKNTEPISWPSLEDAGSSSPDEQSLPSTTQGLSAVVVEKTPGVPSSSSSPPSGGEAAPGSTSIKPAHIKGSPSDTTITDSSPSVKIESA